MSTYPGLGYPPDEVPLYLAESQMFAHEETHPTGTWPTGMSAVIEFANGVTWTATVAGAVLSWRVDPPATNATAIPDRTRYQLALVFPRDGGGSDRYVWFGGSVNRIDKLRNI